MEESLATRFEIGKLISSSGYQKSMRNILDYFGLSSHLQIRAMENSEIKQPLTHTFLFNPYTTRSRELGGSSVAKVKQEVPKQELC